MKTPSNSSSPYNPEIYQDYGRGHLLENRHAALFAGMGLGKTAMVLDAANELFNDLAIRSVLVVAPIRVCNLTWPNEVAKWEQFKWMRVANLRTPEGRAAYHERSAHIYTTNYEALPALCHNLFSKELKRFKNLAFDVIVWDEISKAKNHSSVRVNAMRKFWENIERHWGLTGTPAPNSEMDLFAQIRLLDNGKRLGQSFHHFRSCYFCSFDLDGRKWGLRAAEKAKIEARVADIALVLKSSEWLDIPDTIVEDVEVTLPEKARGQYKQFAKELYMLIDEKDEVEAVNAAVLVNKLLQITSGAIYDADRKVIPLHDAKIKALKTVVARAEGPLIITYQYRHEAARIKEAFPDAVLFSDAKSHQQQDALAAKWNAGEIPLLVASPQSIGHGLNMQEGGWEICWFSLTWSRELYDQMNARVARKGQERVCCIYRLLCPETMDDAVAGALESKGAQQSALLDTIDNFRKMPKM